MDEMAPPHPDPTPQTAPSPSPTSTVPNTNTIPPPESHPLISTLPPTTDYLTYLTLLSHHLPRHPADLTVLNTVLQDERLTTNIGWDLILLLLPFLRGVSDAARGGDLEGVATAAGECLLSVARRGNPRECLVKVAEALVVLEFGDGGGGGDADGDGDGGEDVGGEEGGEGASRVHGHGFVHGGQSAGADADVNLSVTDPDPDPESHTSPSSYSLPLPIRQFTTLTAMLGILHSRVRTKYPSRFVSTTLQAVLPAYSEIVSSHRNPQDVEVVTAAVVDLVRNLHQTAKEVRKPALPPRRATGDAAGGVAQPAPATATAPASTLDAKVADPEASTVALVGEDDKRIQARLLQAFATHVLERYLTSIPSSPFASEEDVPGLAWSGKVMERMFPQMRVPGRKGVDELFASRQVLKMRKTVVGSVVELCRELDLCQRDLLVEAAGKISVAEDAKEGEDEDEPPASVDDVDLSQVGALLLLAEEAMSRNSPSDSSWQIPIFPQQAALIRNVIGTDTAGGPSTAGIEPAAVIDAVIALGLAALDADAVGEPTDDNDFLRYLQMTSLISANTPTPSLRFNAHMLTTTVLRSHPSDELRLSFIIDTLEHCPYENLKVSAVGWIKGETLEANPPAPMANSQRQSPTVFATPVALQSVGEFLFPDLSMAFTVPLLSDAWMAFKTDLSFYMATLNFCYLLLTARYLHRSLDVAALDRKHDIGGTVIGPLREATSLFRDSLHGGQLAEEEGEIGVEASLMDLDILEHVLGRVEQGILELNREG